MMTLVGYTVLWVQKDDCSLKSAPHLVVVFDSLQCLRGFGMNVGNRSDADGRENVFFFFFRFLIAERNSIHVTRFIRVRVFVIR